jgi:predicted RND superfamily exporter protein
MAAGLPQLRIRTDGRALQPDGSVEVEWTERDRMLFDESERVVVLLNAEHEADSLVSVWGLRTLREVHDALSALEGIGDAEVRSLANLVDVVSDSEQMAVGELLDSIPRNEIELAHLRTRIQRHPLGHGVMLAEDDRSAALYVYLGREPTREQSVAALRAWIAANPLAGARLRLTGPVVAEVQLGEVVLRDLAWQVPVMIAVVSLLLYSTLGTIGGVVVPLAEALFVLCWTLGAMAWLGAPATLVTTILPIILFAISISDEIHLLERVQFELAAELKDEGGARPSRPDRAALERALRAGLAAIGRPIVLTSLTTALGFLSFCTASIEPLRQFGLAAAFGLLLAMVLTFTVIPAFMLVLPPHWFMREAAAEGRGTAHRAHRVERFVLADPRRSFLLCGLIVAIAAPGVSRLIIQDSWIDNFSPDAPVVSAERDFNREFWGTYRFDVVAEGPEGIFASTAGVKLLEYLEGVARDVPHVGGVLSRLVSLREAAESVDVDAPLSELSNRQIADLDTLLSFTGGLDDSLRLVSADESSARWLIFVRSANYQRGTALADALERGIRETSLTDDFEWHFSGDIPVALALVQEIVSNQLRSIALTLVGIGCVLFVLHRRAGAVGRTLLPVLGALLLLFGLMGYAGLPLGIATSMFASMTIGIGVDFALHFQHGYQRASERGASPREALEASFSSAGVAIRWNVRVLSVGFAVLVFSELGPNRSLGLLLSAAMLSSYSMTIFGLPWLLERSTKKQSRRLAA